MKSMLQFIIFNDVLKKGAYVYRYILDPYPTLIIRYVKIVCFQKFLEGFFMHLVSFMLYIKGFISHEQRI